VTSSRWAMAASHDSSASPGTGAIRIGSDRVRVRLAWGARRVRACTGTAGARTAADVISGCGEPA
jgi:hypothetical protein